METTLRDLTQQLLQTYLSPRGIATQMPVLPESTCYTSQNHLHETLHYRSAITPIDAHELVELRTHKGCVSISYKRSGEKIKFSIYSQKSAIDATMDIVDDLELAHEHDEDFAGVNVVCDELIARKIFAASLEKILLARPY